MNPQFVHCSAGPEERIPSASDIHLPVAADIHLPGLSRGRVGRPVQAVQLGSGDEPPRAAARPPGLPSPLGAAAAAAESG